MTLKVDLDLESADPICGFCEPSHQERHLGEVNFINRSKCSEDIERTQN